MLGAKLLISTAFHPQTDGASKRAIRNVVQILRAIVQPDQRDWIMKLSMAEFALNSRISSSTRFAPFELNCEHMPMLMQCINEGRPLTALGVRTFIQQAIVNLGMAHDAIIESQVVQTHHTNKKWNEGRILQVGDLVYLSTVNLTMSKGQVRKLMPKYIGPMKVLNKISATDIYSLDLLEEMHKGCIHLTFHIRLLCQYEENDDALFPRRDAQAVYDVRQTNEKEWVVNVVIAH